MCSHAITSTMRNVVRDLVKAGAEEAEAGTEQSSGTNTGTGSARGRGRGIRRGRGTRRGSGRGNLRHMLSLPRKA